MASIGQDVDYAAKLFGASIEYIDLFRLLMRKYGALISGSSVLRLFVEDEAVRSRQQLPSWAPSDLDIYVSRASLGLLGLLEWHVHFTTVERMKRDELQRESEQEYNGGQVSLAECCCRGELTKSIGVFVCQWAEWKQNPVDSCPAGTC